MPFMFIVINVLALLAVAGVGMLLHYLFLWYVLYMPQECSITPAIAIGHVNALKVSFSQTPSEKAIKLAPNIEASDSLYFTFCKSFE